MWLAKRTPTGPDAWEGATFRNRDLRADRAIVVPLQDIASADEVVSFAAAVAERLKRHVRLVHVRLPASWDADDDMVMVDNGSELAFRLRRSDHLDAVAQRWSDAANVDISITARVSPSLASVVEEECRTGSELVVLPREARSLWRRLWFGGEFVRLLRARVPVLVQPHGAPYGSRRPAAEFERVLVWIDEHAAAAQTVRLAVGLGGSNAHYDLLGVLPMRLLSTLRLGQASEASANHEAVDRRNQAWFALSRAREQISQMGGDVETSLIFDNLSAGRAILSQAVSRRADLLVLPRRPQSGLPWAHCAWRHVALNADVPVLLCPDPSS